MIGGGLIRGGHYYPEEPDTLYHVQAVEEIPLDKKWWEVINNRSGKKVASFDNHDDAHRLKDLLTQTQVLLTKRLT